MNNYFKVIKQFENVYQINDSLGVCQTLIIGETKALLIDTGYGIGNLYEEVRKLTSKELIVVNSHGHMDHTLGNYQFNEVYIHKNDFELLKLHHSLEIKNRTISKASKFDFDKEKYLSRSYGNILFILENEIIDLGNLTVFVILIQGHTKGSLAFYIKEKKVLVTSDGLCPYVWLFLNESTNVSTYINSINSLDKLDFEYFLVGHGGKIYSRNDYYKFLDIAKSIDLNNITKFNFDGFNNLNSYCYTKTYPYDPLGCGVFFDPNKL